MTPASSKALLMNSILRRRVFRESAVLLEISATEQSAIRRRQNGDAWFLCTWCEELFPESELRKEADLGHLCDRCIAAIHSRGERLSLEY